MAWHYCVRIVIASSLQGSPSPVQLTKPPSIPEHNGPGTIFMGEGEGLLKAETMYLGCYDYFKPAPPHHP